MDDCTSQVDLESTPTKTNLAVAGIATITAAVLGTATAANADGYVNGHYEPNGSHGYIGGDPWTSSSGGITVYLGHGDYGNAYCVSLKNGRLNFCNNC